MSMELKEAIEVLKHLKYWYESPSHGSISFSGSDTIKAIDTVVADVENPTTILEQSDDKRLLFSAYLQGKRDQIYWATKWEELKPIGKYRMMKQFLAWYQTLKLKEITK